MFFFFFFFLSPTFKWFRKHFHSPFLSLVSFSYSSNQSNRWIIFTSFQLKFLLSPKDYSHARCVWAFIHPRQTCGSGWPCWEQRAGLAALQRSSPTSALPWSSATSNDFTLFDRIGGGIPVFPVALRYFPALSTCGSCLWKSVQELNWILSQAPSPNLFLAFSFAHFCALQSHVGDGKK